MRKKYYNELLNELKCKLRTKRNIADAVTLRRDAKAKGVVPEDTKAAWTNALLNVLADIGRKRDYYTEPTRLYLTQKFQNSPYGSPKRQDDAGEFITDLCWWRGVDKETEIWWNAPQAEALEMELVVESEWGNFEAGIEKHIEEISDDYCKLLFLRAKKRLLLTSVPSKHFDRLVNALRKLRIRAGLEEGDVCIWIWGWDASWEQAPFPKVLFS